VSVWQRHILLGLTIAGLVGSAIALLFDVHSTLVAWLAAVVAASAVPVGSLAVLFFTYMIRRAWTSEMHVPLTAAALTIPVCGILFVPVIAGMRWLYPWVDHRPEHAFQAIYLTPWAFILRNILYFSIWSLLAFWARAAWGNEYRMTRVGSIGLIIYALTGSFAGIDWIQTLTPEFHSSIYGLLFLTFQLLAGLSFGVAMVAVMRPRSHYLAGYGALLLATLLLWAYIHAMQYIIIWSGNIPDEIQWYIRRLADGWGFVLWGLVFLQFIVPFFAMLSERIRSRPYPLLTIATGTLALRFVESFLLVLPAAEAPTSVLWLAIPAAIATTTGILGLSLQLCLTLFERSSHDLRWLSGTKPA
jgi:hypothetical protein